MSVYSFSYPLEKNDKSLVSILKEKRIHVHRDFTLDHIFRAR